MRPNLKYDGNPKKNYKSSGQLKRGGEPIIETSDSGLIGKKKFESQIEIKKNLKELLIQL